MIRANFAFLFQEFKTPFVPIDTHLTGDVFRTSLKSTSGNVAAVCANANIHCGFPLHAEKKTACSTHVAAASVTVSHYGSRDAGHAITSIKC